LALRPGSADVALSRLLFVRPDICVVTVAFDTQELESARGSSTGKTSKKIMRASQAKKAGTTANKKTKKKKEQKKETASKKKKTVKKVESKGRPKKNTKGTGAKKGRPSKK
jgi:hypothetical protein